MHRIGTFALLSAAALLLGACTAEFIGEGVFDGGGGDGGGRSDVSSPDIRAPHTLVTISVTPTNQILEVDLNRPAAQQFKAIGHFLDNRDEDLSGKVTWASSNSKVGAFNGTALQIPAMAATAAEVTLVTASYQGMTGRAQLTVVAYRKSGSKLDFFFILPYNDKTGNKSKPLDFKTDVSDIDVFINMDCTGSMRGEINNLQSGLKTLVVPGIQAQIPGTQFGAGAFMDFPISPYGNSGQDQPFMLFQTMTTNVSLVQSAVDRYTSGGNTIGYGGDGPESALEALYQIATGAGLTSPPPTSVPPNTTGVGGVGFRKGKMPVVVTITDALFHAPGETSTACSSQPVDYTNASVAAVAATRATTKAALAKICARSVGVVSVSGATGCTGLADLEDFAKATGARVPPGTWDVPSRPSNCPTGQCCTGQGGAAVAADADGLCPLVFQVDSNGTGLSNSMVAGLKMLTAYAPFDVTTALVGETADTKGLAMPSGKTTADFIKGLKPTSFKKPPPPPNLPNPTMDAKSFKNVSPGTTVTFAVEAYNDFLDATNQARIFRATIKVLAGSCTDLDQREVFILVPPKAIIR